MPLPRFFLYEGRTLRSPEAAAWDKLSAFSTSLMLATGGPSAAFAPGGFGGGGGGAAGIGAFALMMVTFWGKETMERKGRKGKEQRRQRIVRSTQHTALNHTAHSARPNLGVGSSLSHLVIY